MTPEEQGRAILTAAFNAIGSDIVQVVRDEISTQYPPSSDPDTPPHRRTGNLQNQISFTVDEFHDGVTFNLVSSAFYSGYLRDGRDFFGQEAIDRYVPIIVQRLQDYINGASSGGGAPPVNSAYGLIYPSTQAA